MNRYIMGFFSVFPACAGVILGRFRPCVKTLSIPRMRGGDPDNGKSLVVFDLYSPHARG